MRHPKQGDKVAQVLVITTLIMEVLEINHFTNSAKVKDSEGRTLLINQRKTADALYQVVEVLDGAES